MNQPLPIKPADPRWEQACAAILEQAQNGAAPEAIAQLVGRLAKNCFRNPQAAHEFFYLCEAAGVHVTPVHFYQPIPDTRALPEKLWQEDSQLPGLDMNHAGQVKLLTKAFPKFKKEYDVFPKSPTGTPHEFYFDNGLFSGTDALVLYCMVRHFRPRLMLEVGSGFSSRLSALAAVRNGNTRLICIEPYPEAALVNGFPGLTSLIQSRVQDVPLKTFQELGDGDILFIDSSHVAACGSDVNFLFLEILPRLRPGVIVHVHDIFLPGDYPRDWVKKSGRFWNEQYLLQAFLAFNAEFEVLLANSYLGRHHPAEFKTVFPNSPWHGGGSFWMRRK